MWADNETSVDLLGFDALVDSLEIILCEASMLPVTVGVTGDWGSGKSSLMRMAQERLAALNEEDGKFITIAFSPWKFEDYDDIKAALMQTVVDAISEFVADDDDLKQRVAPALTKVRMLIGRLRLAGSAARMGTAAAGGGPAEIAAAGAAADAMDEALKNGTPAAEQPAASFETVAEFHREFERLVDELGESVDAVVVFIDDVDRSSADAIVDTFEAIRLFLNAPKTAYVIGANEAIVESVLAARYPSRTESGEALGRHYLEKMLQASITVPPLSEPEGLTYINLLFAQLHTDEGQFAKLLDRSREIRQASQLSVAMNAGIAKDALEDLPDDLNGALATAARIGPALSRGLRGNPRQIKRFLNTLLLRSRTATKRGAVLQESVLGKLMVLEFLNTRDFEQLFLWQLAVEGSIPELEIAEKLARGEKIDDAPNEVEAWALQPGVKRWIALEPPLAETDLRPYFSYSRDRLARGFLSLELPSSLQRLLTALRNELEPVRKDALDQAAQLNDHELFELIPALLEVATADPSGEAMASAIALGEKRPETLGAVFSALSAIPDTDVTAALALRVHAELGGDQRADELLNRWADRSGRQVKTAITQARKISA